MNHKIVKMHLSTWRKLRGLFPSMKGETANDYFNRIHLTLKRLQLDITKKDWFAQINGDFG